jgi:hypothetical protein
MLCITAVSGRVGEARRNRVHADAFRGEFERRVARQHFDAGLGATVRDAAEHRHVRVQRRHVDDGAAIAVRDHAACLVFH